MLIKQVVCIFTDNFQYSFVVVVFFFINRLRMNETRKQQQQKSNSQEVKKRRETPCVNRKMNKSSFSYDNVHAKVRLIKAIRM